MMRSMRLVVLMLGSAFALAACTADGGSDVASLTETTTTTAGTAHASSTEEAVLAFAEEQDLSGREVIRAYVLGGEIECRIGLSVSPSHYARGWHITATCGVFGAAAASARLLGLPGARVADALGIERFTIVGHDWGGALAWGVALRGQHERVASGAC